MIPLFHFVSMLSFVHYRELYVLFSSIPFLINNETLLIQKTITQVYRMYT